MKEKAYLGDGVYAIINEFAELVLTTENGVTTTNKIFLESNVFDALLDYCDVKRITTKYGEQE